ncbi:protein translocase subunit SecF, partial [Patescibacteria group bacterium]|nr:protein translocase subunit SecF [Patescibacteria group bacterium]
MINIIQNRKIYFSISSVLVGASIVVVAMFGLNLGIDFKGGSLMEVSMHEQVETDIAEIEQILTQAQNDAQPILESVRVQSTGDKGFVLRFKDVTQDEHQQILSALNSKLSEGLELDDAFDIEESSDTSIPDVSGIQAVDSEGNPVDITFEAINDDSVISSPMITIGGTLVVEEMRFESIGPIIGQELQDKAVRAILTVLIAIVLYIAWAFRKVSDPVSSWKYGITAIIALAHDVIIPTGIFVVLGVLYNVEIDILFVTAVLTILGFSVNDTIVVFDRTRENLARDHHKHDFDWIVNKSVNETIRRSIYTSFTTFVVLFAIYLYGGDTIKNFALALMIGVVVGTYSSIFLASPLLVVWEKWSRR